MELVHQSIADALFQSPSLEVYAVLDAASLPELLPHLDSLKPDNECLFRGELKPGMEEVAPYLVRLDNESRFFKWLLEDGWGKHPGIFALADASLLPMRLHFRKHLRVYTESGDPKLFRFYDPRVLRVFAPTLLPPDDDAFFGPVVRYLCESKDGAALESFRRRDGTILHERLALEPGAEWKAVKQ